MDTPDDITQAASAMGKKGGKRGGAVRAQTMTAEERTESARHAALSRWQTKFPQDQPGGVLRATHGAPNRPLRIGDLEIPCYVLEDGRRVIMQRGMLHALAVGKGRRGDQLASFVHQKTLEPFIPGHLHEVTTTPIFFITPNGNRAYGYEATVLADICTAVLQARDAGVLRPQQQHIAEQCEMLMRGFSRVGIIGLVDEATGYQEARDRDELHRILAAYISPTLMPWTQRFPEDFYVQLCRLKKWTYTRVYKGPRRIAQLTKQLVYDQLPPGVLDELQRLNPPVYKGYSRKHRHHQFLTDTIGNPHLEKHMLALVTILRLAETWEQFEQFFAKTFPAPTQPLALEIGAEVVDDALP